MALHGPGRNAESGGHLVRGQALEMAEHEYLSLAGGKPPEGRPNAYLLLAPNSLLLGGDAGAGRLVRVELDTLAAPPPPPPGLSPVPADVHRDPGHPGGPVVGRRRAECSFDAQEHVVGRVGRLVNVGEQEPAKPEDPLSVGPIKGIERWQHPSSRVQHPKA